MKHLTTAQKMNAYQATKERFGLKAEQRDQLDTCPSYLNIMVLADAADWETVQRLLTHEGII